jgi:hypothetical protein
VTWLAYTLWSALTFAVALPFATSALVLRMIGGACEWAVDRLEAVGFWVLQSGGW